MTVPQPITSAASAHDRYGFDVPTGWDSPKYGDDAINRNARITADWIDHLVARVNDIPSLTQPPSLTIGTVVKRPASDQPTATITGTWPNWVLSLGIPAGQPDNLHVSGNGQPPGKVDAWPGTTYVDLQRTAGAWVWFSPAGGTGDWHVIAGDTGWRDITPATWPTPVVSGKALVRRFNTTVTLRLVDIVWAAVTIPASFQPWPGGLPAGFNPNTSNDRQSLQLEDAAVVLTDVVANLGGGWLRLMRRMGYGGFVGSIAAGGAPRTGAYTYTTSDAWPTTLPGTAA